MCDVRRVPRKKRKSRKSYVPKMFGRIFPDGRVDARVRCQRPVSARVDLFYPSLPEHAMSGGIEASAIEAGQSTEYPTASYRLIL